jgi:glycerophosphoryl diester phosphodiesterase
MPARHLFRLLSCSLALAAAAGEPRSPSLRERLPGFSVAGHRGDHYSFAGNTLAGFEQARVAGVQIVEMDLRLSADGVPVVHHDAEINAYTFGVSGEIGKLSAAQIRAGRVFGLHPIPTFEEVLAWSHGRVVINAEFKTPDVIAAAVALVQKHRAHDWVYFQTKSDHARYETARRLDPRVALLYKPVNDADLEWAVGRNDPCLVVIELGPSMSRPEVIRRVHAAGKLASENAWPHSRFQELWGQECEAVFAAGIDIAVTNRPAGGARAAAARNAATPAK